MLKEIKSAETLETLKAKSVVLGIHRDRAIDQAILGLKRNREDSGDSGVEEEWKRLRQDHSEESDEWSSELDEASEGGQVKKVNSLLAGYDSD